MHIREFHTLFLGVSRSFKNFLRICSFASIFKVRLRDHTFALVCSQGDSNSSGESSDLILVIQLCFFFYFCVTRIFSFAFKLFYGFSSVNPEHVSY